MGQVKEHADDACLRVSFELLLEYSETLVICHACADPGGFPRAESIIAERAKRGMGSLRGIGSITKG